MRQVIEVIRERRSIDDARTRAYIEWQTRALASFISATAMSEDGSQKMQQAAAQLSMTPTRPEDKPAAIEPRQGSFEKLVGLFGNTPNK